MHGRVRQGLQDNCVCVHHTLQRHGSGSSGGVVQGRNARHHGHLQPRCALCVVSQCLRRVRCALRGGVQSATEYTCQTPAGEDIDEEYCDVDNQPEEAPTRPCNSEACMYKYGLYGSCSRSCGEGTKKRTATCIEPYGSKKVDDSFCDSLGKPVLSTKCTGTNCGTWSAGDDWSACTLECNGGQQTNKFECRDANKKVLTDSRCLGPKPADLKRNCNTGACAWVVDTSSACSKS
eukprot:Opistho-2@17640